MAGTPTHGCDVAVHGGTPTARRGAEAQDTLVSRALRAARAGDRDACAFLYARYADDVYVHVHRLLGDHEEAQDVVQRVFARLIHMIGACEARGEPFLPWALQVARSTAGEQVCERPAPVGELRVSAHKISTWSAPPPMPR
jgi:hypothetical protein